MLSYRQIHPSFYTLQGNRGISRPRGAADQMSQRGEGSSVGDDERERYYAATGPAVRSSHQNDTALHQHDSLAVTYPRSSSYIHFVRGLLPQSLVFPFICKTRPFLRGRFHNSFPAQMLPWARRTRVGCWLYGWMHQKKAWVTFTFRLALMPGALVLCA
jgi:hypothetical protein